MATNYPTFQSDPILNSVTASTGVSGSLGAFSNITASNISGTNNLLVGGKVGIGITNPARQLSIVGQLSVVSGAVGEDVGYNGTIISTKTGSSNQHINLIRAANHVRSLGFAPNSNTFLIAGGETTDSNFGINMPFSIDSVGNVGVGVVNPVGKLNVDVATLANNTDTLQRWSWNTSNVWGLDLDQVHAGSRIDYAFRTKNNSVTDVEAIYLKSDGNIGIGITAPNYKLDVSGTGRFTSNVEITGTLKGVTQLSASTGVSSSLALLTTITASNISGTNNLFIGSNVGIGTNNVSLQGGGSGLAINGTSYTQVKLTGVGGAGIQLSGSRQYEINSDSGNAFFVLNRSIDNNAYRLIIRDNTVLFPTSSLSIGGAYDRVPAYTCDVTGSGRFTSTLVVSGGIQFPATQVLSSDPNTLDDYEEGDWTPAITGSVSSTGITYSILPFSRGKYVKVGRQAILHGVIFLSSTGSASGNVRIGNLPFAAENVGSFYYSCNFSEYSSFNSSITNPPFGDLFNFTYIAVKKSAAGGSSNLSITDLTNTSAFGFTVIYNVA